MGAYNVSEYSCVQIIIVISTKPGEFRPHDGARLVIENACVCSGSHFVYAWMCVRRRGYYNNYPRK